MGLTIMSVTIGGGLWLMINMCFVLGDTHL
jgi:hypothetical protein